MRDPERNEEPKSIILQMCAVNPKRITPKSGFSDPGVLKVPQLSVPVPTVLSGPGILPVASSALGSRSPNLWEAFSEQAQFSLVGCDVCLL